MKRIGLMMLALLAMTALGGVTASSSTAAPLEYCVQVDQQNTGDWANPECIGKKEVGNYIQIKALVKELKNGQWCAEVKQPGTGDWPTNSCEGVKEVGNFIMVRRTPPNWHMNGTKLGQGSSAGITGQSKGNLVLKSKAAGIDFVITCSTSSSVGTIDGQSATLQGQGKGTVKYEICKIEPKEPVTGCAVAEPINTTQLKAHLATAAVQQKEQIVSLFEPSESTQNPEKIFTTIKIVKCNLLNGAYPVKGSVVGTLSPQEAEGQEGSLFFPETPIAAAKHEGQEVHPGLTLGGAAAIFTGFYSQKLQSGKFGVFNN